MNSFTITNEELTKFVCIKNQHTTTFIVRDNNIAKSMLKVREWLTQELKENALNIMIKCYIRNCVEKYESGVLAHTTHNQKMVVLYEKH